MPHCFQFRFSVILPQESLRESICYFVYNESSKHHRKKQRQKSCFVIQKMY